MIKVISRGALVLILVSLLTACAPAGGKMQAASASVTNEITTQKREDTMMAPDFELQDLAGNTVKLSDFSGQKIYIKYWASWCPICLGGLEDLNTLSGEDTDFKILTIVSPGQKGEKNTEDFKAWFAGVENTANITVLLDESGTYTAAAGVRGYPTSEWIDEDQNIIGIAPGHQDNDKIETGFSDMR